MSAPPCTTRRDALRAAIAVGATVALSHGVPAATGSPIIKAIPSSGQKLPVIGIGTNNFDVSDAPDLAARRAVLARLLALDGSVVDTAPLYGRSETVVGGFMTDLHIRDRLFIATKVMARDAQAGEASMEESMRRLMTPHIDLMQVHNLFGVEPLIPVLQDWKKSGRIGYFGVTTSNTRDHARLLDYMRRLPLDFIQVDYSLADRDVEHEVLPLAAQRGIGVIANSPFGGRRAAASVFAQVAGKPLPAWAADIGVTSWSQLFLKFVISHPAVTCTVPGTTAVQHLDDNMAAGRGVVPDDAMRLRMTAFWNRFGT